MPLPSQRDTSEVCAEDISPNDRQKGVGLLRAFNRACERDELELAAVTLVKYERIVTRLPISLNGARRIEMANLVSAHVRLWELLQASIEE